MSLDAWLATYFVGMVVSAPVISCLAYEYFRREDDWFENFVLSVMWGVGTSVLWPVFLPFVVIQLKKKGKR